MTAITLTPRARKRIINRGLDVLTWLVVAAMLAPVFWLVASSLQNDGQLARGSYDLLHPTFQAFRDMWNTIDFERYLINSAIICTVAALLATAFASTAGYALSLVPVPVNHPGRCSCCRSSSASSGSSRTSASSSSTRAWG